MKLKDKPYYHFLLALLSGFLFWLGWPTKPMAYALFFAFVPLLTIEDYLSQSDLKRKGWKFFGYCYIALLTWNVLTTYWIYNATAEGGMFAMAANAVLMCIPLMLFYFTKKATNPILGYTSFVVYCVTFEYWHLNWQLSWPWLTLGNGFASVPGLIQWYEYTGALGGTLWILLVNLCMFKFYKVKKGSSEVKKYYVYALLLYFIPILTSFVIDSTYKEQGQDVEIVIVQPNIDPYEEKFMGSDKFIPYEKQLERLIDLSKKEITQNTRYVVWPETALPYGYFEENLKADPTIEKLKSFIKEYPNATLVTGLDTYKLYQTKATPSSTYLENIGYRDAFNSAMQINESSDIAIYHKSKLVPGVEYMPPALNSLAIAMGESAGGLGQQQERTVFFNKDHIGIAPVICYESIFGDFVTEYIRKGANLIFIITNDGWWGNTQGHKQHLEFGALRAIENRKSIARSANTGISGFIDQRGRILKQSRYWEQDVMKMTLKENNIQTFYSLHGDYLGAIAALISFAAIIIALITIINKKIKIKQA